MAARQQRKATPEAPPPAPRTAIPPPANDNRLRWPLLLAGVAVAAATLAVFVLIRAYG